MSKAALLQLRVRHEPGALTRIVSILNPFPVTELSYAVDDDGHAHARVRLDAGSDVVARVHSRLARVVPVLEVSRQSETPHPPARSGFIGADEDDPAADLAPICV